MPNGSLTRTISVPWLEPVAMAPKDFEVTKFGDSGATTFSAPPLTPKRLEPQNFSSAALPLGFLADIDRIEISKTNIRNGVTYYVMDVYERRRNSRLPTNLQRTPRSRAHSSLDNVPPSPTSSSSSEPSYSIERRFSQFAHLREQLFDRTCDNANFICEYCSGVVHHTRFNLNQPRLFVKLVTGVEKRKKILTTFMNDVLELVQSTGGHFSQCEAYVTLPLLLQSFLQE